MDLTYRTKLLLVMCGMVLLTGLVVIAVADQNSRRSTATMVDALFREVSGHTASQTKDLSAGGGGGAVASRQLAAGRGLGWTAPGQARAAVAGIPQRESDGIRVSGEESSGDYTARLRCRWRAAHRQHSISSMERPI